LAQKLVVMMGQLRHHWDLAGGAKKILVLAGDASFCHRTCCRAPRERTEWIARTRRDAGLCPRAPEERRRFFSAAKFTPEQFRQEERRPWQTTKVFS
jgi:hypothetical protein